MATIKHISSKNADYGAAEQYLTFQHDEFTMKPVLDVDGRLVPREDYRIEMLNCGGEDFALSCLRANMKYKKNSQREDVKSHHYIISFDPRDAADNGLTVDRAQRLGLAYCKEHFPGHQAIVCTHPDGHNHSGNIHVHIVINSLRIAEIERKPYMDKPCDTREGAKHRCTAAALRYFRSEVMEMCHREGLYQIDLLNGGKEKVTEREYWAKKRGQQKLDEKNAPMVAGGITPRKTKFETVKDELRRSIRTALSGAASFEEFSTRLMRDYGIAVKESRGRLSYLTPERTKPITARKLGTDFDKAAVLAVLVENASRAAGEITSGMPPVTQAAADIPLKQGKESITECLERAQKQAGEQEQGGVQRMVDIERKLSEGKGAGYAHWAKKFNLQQMSQTMVFLERYGFESQEDVEKALKEAMHSQNQTARRIKAMERDIKANKELMRQIEVYRRTKPAYDRLKTIKREKRREEYEEQNRTDLALYSAACRFFKEQGLTKLPAAARVQAETEELISQKNTLYTELREKKGKTAEMRSVRDNLEAILAGERRKGKEQGIDL